MPQTPEELIREFRIRKTQVTPLMEAPRSVCAIDEWVSYDALKKPLCEPVRGTNQE